MHSPDDPNDIRYILTDNALVQLYCPACDFSAWTPWPNVAKIVEAIHRQIRHSP